MILPREYTALPAGVPINPMQELVVPHMDKDYNIMLAGPTASGKSTAIYMCGWKYIEAGDRIGYIGIMRALAQEKSDDLDDPEHPWNDVARTVISGEYTYDEMKQKEIDEAQFVCITPESLASRLRHPNSERNRFLGQIKLLVIDEIHLLGDEGRGAHLEAALMEFCLLYPDVQLLGLSATVPNVEDVCGFMTKLNGKYTAKLVSDYRSVPLVKHYIPVLQQGTYAEYKQRVVDHCAHIRMDNAADQFMYAVFSKAFGNELVKKMQEDYGINAEFHNANIEKESRRSIERRFKDKNLKDLVSTSTLFTGVNLPARHIVITAVTAGGGPIPAHQLLQAIGRAGRPRYDSQGDAWVLIPKNPNRPEEFEFHKNRIENGEPVKSTMQEPEYLAVHLLGAIYVNRVNNLESFKAWFKRTLAYEQIHPSYREKEATRICEETIEALSSKKVRMLVDKAGTFELTRRGVIAAQMYLCPYHFSDLLANLGRLFALNSYTDHDIAKAFGMCFGFQSQASTMEKNECVPAFWGTVADMYLKAVSVCYLRIQSERIPSVLYNLDFQIREDAQRLHAACVRAHAESQIDNWDVPQERVDHLFLRLIKKLSAAEADLAISKFTKRERKLLNEMGIYSMQEVRDNLSLAREVLKPERLLVLGLTDAAGNEKRKVRAFGGR